MKTTTANFKRGTAPNPNIRFLETDGVALYEVGYWKPMADTPAKRLKWEGHSNIQWIPSTPEALAMVQEEKDLELEVYSSQVVELSTAQLTELEGIAVNKEVEIGSAVSMLNDLSQLGIKVYTEI